MSVLMLDAAMYSTEVNTITFLATNQANAGSPVMDAALSECRELHKARHCRALCVQKAISNIPVSKLNVFN